ncbi:MAG: hypothetical protein QOK46_1696, partial [Microbacteriaceae bacterium]|nr:hypothetical protein [Microbacteriaceae bacterium]
MYTVRKSKLKGVTAAVGLLAA